MYPQFSKSTDNPLNAFHLDIVIKFNFLNKLKKSKKKIDFSDSLAVFISSTFLDMQRERDILSRLIFPRLRAFYQSHDLSIQEIDLRWGVTKAMTTNEGSVEICLNEIENCSPNILGIVGHRVGWKPRLKWLHSKKLKVLNTKDIKLGLTEIELQFAANFAKQKGNCAPAVLFRSDNLSQLIHQSQNLGFDDSTEVEKYRKRVSSLAGIEISFYDSFEEFETKAEILLKKIIDSALNKGNFNNIIDSKDLYIYERLKELKSIEKASRKTPTLLVGKPKVGVSWVLNHWAKNTTAEKTIIIDGRFTNVNAFSDAIRGDQLETSLSQELHLNIQTTLDFLPPLTCIAIDHFEEAFDNPTLSDLTLFPTHLPRGNLLVVATREPRLITQAKALKWQVINIPALSIKTVSDFSEKYLNSYGKKLTISQKKKLTEAPWAIRIGAVVLVLEELRRFGNIENLDKRINELVACDTDESLGKEVLRGLNSALPETWLNALNDILIALAISLNGLDETELRNVVASFDEKLPYSLLSTFRVSLRSIFVERGNRIDLANGPIATIVQDIVENNPMRTVFIIKRLDKVLADTHPTRWIEMAPCMALSRGGVDELEVLLSDPQQTLALISVGHIFADGWMSKLNKQARFRVVSSWIKWVEDTKDSIEWPDREWKLGCIAARSGVKEIALRFFQIDTSIHPSRSHRDLVIAFTSPEKDNIEKVKSNILNFLNNEKLLKSDIISSIVFVLGVVAEGKLKLDEADLESLLRALSNFHDSGNSSALTAQSYIILGQLKLNKADWQGASQSFGRAESAARFAGHARLLCRALERGAAIALERNQFRQARRLAAECRELAEAAGLKELEALSFERLIEIATRLSDWKEAYQLVEAYFCRCDETLGNHQRAQDMLNSIET